ncbi:FecCD family ABC transporter permease [Pseudonocardia sp. H11422]|uniref:FecCD family ABC transporter permease n=1 Tax=Pseudonocardia sp. H11422 TaxID=2835866 RepID=UPI001BDD0E6C|nr:iron chelate uptake ABC transporter family permease subunit [Pseudonocardia sp. H11422]
MNTGLVLRRRAVSLRLSPASVLLGSVTWALALAVAAVSLTLGDYPMSLSEVAATLTGNGTLISYDVVVRNRLPRALVALGVGAALAISGGIFQRLARNPLVSPDVIGINAGASAGAVVTITVVGAGAGTVAGGALAGAAIAALLVYAIAHRNGFSGYRLVLVGIGVTALLSSAASFLLTRADRNEAFQAAIWLVGTVAGRTWVHVATVAGALAMLAPVVLAPVVLALSRQLRLLELGDDLARTLAGRVQLGRALLLAAGVGLAALATAAAGPIAFVALVAPQIVRRLLAERTAGLVPASGAGALVVVGADLVTRRLFSPYELPAGVITALVGAPVLLYLLVRANRIGAGG